jgi:hypothetical protein
MKKNSLFFILSAAVIAVCADRAASDAPMKRFALVAGSNTGHGGRIQLKYAVNDAHTFANVLTSLGGVEPGDIVFLDNPTLKQFGSGLDRFERMVTRNGAGRKEVVLYYSGHANEKGILLGNELLAYRNLKAYLNQMPAAVRIVVLDACSSGELTREKGGKTRPAFLFDASSAMEGHAYLTSSSENEGAQESDSLGGSFFTHYLVSGLRGGADANSDGKITLDEAYQFAFHGTLKRTEGTYYGPQHPAYDIRLKGSGNLVITDLRESSAGLRLDSAMAGRIFIRGETGTLLVELNKSSGKAMEVGLEPGNYHVILETSNNGVCALDVHLREKDFTDIHENEMRKTKNEMFVLRGDTARFTQSIGEPYRIVPFAISFIPSELWTKSSKAITLVSLGAVASYTTRLHGVDLSGAVSVAGEDVRGVQISGASNIIGNDFQGAQIGGAVNIVRKMGTGVQVAGAVNHTRDMRGIQIAGVCNSAKHMGIGGQIAGAVNVATDERWAPNEKTDTVAHHERLFQIAGVINQAGAMRGVQIAGAGNCANHTSSGVQIAGGANLAQRFHGLQIGTVNYACSMAGVQLGVINISRENSGVPIGVLTIIKNNPPHAQLWTDESGYMLTGIRSGTRYVYSILSIGGRMSVATPGWALGLGLGFRVPLKQLYVGTEAMTMHLNENTAWDTNDYLLLKIRLICGYQIAPHFSIFGGPTINSYWAANKSEKRLAYWEPVLTKSNNHWFALWPGFTTGIEF